MSGRYRAIYRGGKLFAEYEGDELTWLDPEYEAPKASELASPGLIRDQIDPFKSMADGRLYDSKSAYRQDLKRRGLVELGSDAPLIPPKPVQKNTRREAISRQLGDMSDKQADKLLKSLKKAI